MKDLTGKVALVTGGGKGVGKHIARSLAERGANVVINCFHSYDAAKQTKKEIEEATGATVDIVRASVAKREQVDRLFAEVERLHGRLDILVNNAASGSLTPLDGIEPDHFSKALDTNLLGSFWCALGAARLMRRQGSGVIVNVSSIGAGLVPDNYLVVGTSKAAVEALTRHLAAELAPSGIRVNTASCSLITGEVAELFPRAKELQEVALACTPLGRIATAEDMVGVVTFLTSDLSRWVTGQTVLADGGVSLANAMLSPPRKPMPFLPGSASDSAEPGPEPHPVAEEPAASPVEEPVDQPVEVDAEVESAPEPQQAAEKVAVAEEVDDDPVVVVGMGLVVPGANTPQEYWHQMQEGAERFVEAPADRWRDTSFCDDDRSAEDKGYQPKAGFVTGFVPDPELAEEIGRGEGGVEHTTLWLRHSLHQSLRTVRRSDSDRVVYAVGYTADGSQHLEEATVLMGTTRRLGEALAADAGPDDAGQADHARSWFRDRLESRLWRGRVDPSGSLPHEVVRTSMTGLLPDSTRTFVVDTACSSSLYAIDMGVNSLRQGDCDLAVCGGAFALAPRGAVLFSKLNGLSSRGEVRSLDQTADGVLFSDGAGLVVLKRLSRARADGDRVLGVVRSVGSSSDGKGKAIYAPSSDGQSRAVRRAMAGPGVVVEDLDWVVAHATGTPAGDVAEFTTLRETVGGDHPVQVTSNKSLIGHTGWAAGVVSVIETLLAMEHSTIPRQHRFVSAPEAFATSSTQLQIPSSPVPWPARPDRPRTASVSGFGFGGTNAHVVLEEYVGQRRAPAEPPYAGERVALVAWASQMPDQDAGSVEGWLRGDGHQPASTFGVHYPLPDFRETRIPPSTMKSLDRCQLMLMACMRQLEEQVGGLVDEHRETTGVLAGHLGPTRNGILYALRCYLEPLRHLVDEADPADRPSLEAAYDRMAAEVRAQVPASNENSFPGMMPNVIPARVANAFDLHGLSMTVDTGFASTLSAAGTAIQYLRAGTLDVALVAGVNGNSTAEMADLLGDRLPEGVDIGEGALMMALVRESTAVARGLEPLAFLDDYRVHEPAPVVGTTIVAVGPTAGGRTWLGADGAVGIMRAVLGGAADSTVVCTEEVAQSPVTSTLRVTRPDAEPEVRRHTVVWRPQPARPEVPTTPFLAPGTLVLTDDPALVDRVVGTGAQAPMVISVGGRVEPGPGRTTLEEVTREAFVEAVRALPQRPRHLRVLSDLSAALPAADAFSGDPARLLALHDLLLLALQDGRDELSRPGASVLLGLLGGVHDGVPHPYAGLFTGLVKAARFELPEALMCAVATSTRDVVTAVAEVEAETAAARLLPVVLYDDGVRHTLDVRQVDPVPGPAPFGPSSVVLAVGGSRGIGAEALKQISREFRPTVYVVGSNPLAAPDDHVGPKQEYLRTAMAERPGLSVSEASREHDRLLNAEQARDSVAAMSSAGAKVTYLTCDVRDAGQVAAVVDRVLAAEGRVDLLLNIAGINRSGFLPGKELSDFRAVRDLKVHAYRNLKLAFGTRRPELWCNFSSLVGFRGQPGETDYASANDFLVTASAPRSAEDVGRETTIGWNLWRDAGLGADPLMLSLLGRRYRFTPMSSPSGVAHLLRELSQPEKAHYMVLMGDGELAELGLREDQVAADVVPRGTFFLGRETYRDEGSLVYERSFGLDSDPYLRDHVVDGVPTLPGTFVTEIAAEAASSVVAGMVVVGFRDLALKAFLRVPPGPAVTRRVRASVLERDDHAATVSVRVTADVVAPTGQLLVQDRLQYETVVLLADEPRPAPQWEPWSDADDGAAVPEPYHVPNPAVHLTDSFVVTTDTRLHRLGRRATSAPSRQVTSPVYGSFLVPALLLDGLLRVGMLDDVGLGFRALNVPTSIERIDLYGAGSDAETAATHPRVDLYSVGSAPTGGGPGDSGAAGLPGGNRAVAATPDGTVVATVEGVTSVALGFVHPGTGQTRDRFSPPLGPVPAARRVAPEELSGAGH